MQRPWFKGHSIVRRFGQDLQFEPGPVAGFRLATYIPDLQARRQNKLFRAMCDLGITAHNVETGFENDLKRIPSMYLNNSREVRLQVLAGLLDADGHYEQNMHRFRFVQSVRSHLVLLQDVAYLARSLGFYVSIPNRSWITDNRPGHEQVEVYRCNIAGDRLHEIPCKLTRKQVTEERFERDPTMRSIMKFNQLDPAPFVHIEVENDNLFVRDDFLVISFSQHVEPEDALPEALSQVSLQDTLTSM